MKINEIIKNANFSVEEEKKAPVAPVVAEEAPKKPAKKAKAEDTE